MNLEFKRFVICPEVVLAQLWKYIIKSLTKNECVKNEVSNCLKFIRV